MPQMYKYADYLDNLILAVLASVWFSSKTRNLNWKLQITSVDFEIVYWLSKTNEYIF